jgi:stage V sporulation protein B
MAPFFIFHYCQGPLLAALQALNLAHAAMINSLIGAVVKTAVIFLLASRIEFGINGAALGIIAGFMLVTVLHFATVLKKVSFTFYISDYAKSFLLIGLSGYLGYWMKNNLAISNHLALNTIAIIASMSFAYTVLMFLFGLIKKEEIKRIPWIGGSLAKWAFW